MATEIQKNTKRLKEQALNKMFARQQQLNGNAGGNGWSRPQLPYENRTPYWPQGGQQALNTIANNYNPGIWGGSYPNVDVTGSYIGNKYGPIHSAGEVTVTGIRKPKSNFFDNTGINPNNFYNNQPKASAPNKVNNPVEYTDESFGSTPEEAGYGDTLPSTPEQKTSSSILPPSVDNNVNFGMGPDGKPISPSYDPKRINTLGIKIPALSGSKTSLDAQNIYNNLESPKLAGFAKGNLPKTPSPTSGFNWSKAGTFAGQAAPMIYNMIKGLQRPEKTRPNYNPYESNIRSLMANRRFNIEPLLSANRTAQAVTNRNIRNTANSRGEIMSNLGASQNYRMAGDASAWAQKNNMDNQYLSEQAQMDATLGSQRSQMDWMTQTANSQNEAATDSFLGQGFNDLGKFAQTQQLMNNQAFRDKQLVGLYPDMFGVYNFMNGAKDIVNSVNKTKRVI